MKISQKFKNFGLANLLGVLGLGVGFVAGPATAAVYATTTTPTVTFVTGTFRTPDGGAAACPGVPAGTDCQIDKFFGDIGGNDNGQNPGADDKLTTVFINKNQPFQGYWTYEDLEEISDPVRGVFRGVEKGVIDARPGLPSTGVLGATYHGATDDGCYELDFGLGGLLDLSGIIDQSPNPVNQDSGVWAGYITSKC